MENQMKIEFIKTSELSPYANNPRKNDKAVDAVASSIKNFGFRVPITIDENRTVVTGHARLKAALKLGLDTVPVIKISDLSDDQIKAFRIADNKVAEIAEWDYAALQFELENIQMDLSEFNFEMPEFNRAVEDDGYEPIPPKEPKAKQGDVYALGRHRLMCGDATNPADVKILLNGELADLLIIDPPYNVNYEGAAGKLENDNMHPEQFESFLTELYKNADCSLKPGAAFYIWHPDSNSLAFRNACRAVGWEIRQCLIWSKNSFVVGRQDYHWQHEPCLYGWKGGGAHYFTGDRTQSTILAESRPVKSEAHPTMKPVRLIGRLIENSSKSGNIVLDLVAGSGSVMAAAEQLGRSAYMMDIDPRCVDVIIDRYQTLTGDRAVKISGD